MTDAQFELLLAAIHEQNEELRAIRGARGRAAGYLLRSVHPGHHSVHPRRAGRAGLAGLARCPLLVTAPSGSRQVRPATLFVWHSVRAASFRPPERPVPAGRIPCQRENTPQQRPFLKIEAAGSALGQPRRECPSAPRSAPHPDTMSETSRKSRQKKRGKWLIRHQPGRKEKHRNGQRRANHEQRHELSKLSATHDARNTNADKPAKRRETASKTLAFSFAWRNQPRS